ncbi:uncharacterized protein LOC114757006 [Neltuma alba]|uniref:uncharacterized protein LOC114739802 n=1 Tax=Neltuma alba TaxID=207710 RepID=UPI0010A45D14|nr:uncharacterized protein LOC114739802 [Prosopis alba]XP_028801830.1 uncharacterized protein LOC114757006 [Prosopis alba]
MESENKQVMQQDKKQKKKELEVFDILKEAVGLIFLKNINFIIFTFLCSLPLFCFMVYFETFLQETLAETSDILNIPPDYSRYYHRSYPDEILGRFSKNYVLKLIQLGLIYLVPLHVLDLCSAIVTIDLASKLRSGEKHMNLKDMFQKCIDTTNLGGTFITSIFVQFLTNCHMLGLLFIVTIYLVVLRYVSFYGLFAVICSLGFAKLLGMYLEWSATWNMSIVISVLEGIHGIDALVLSGYFNRGCQRRGLFLMLFFFAWGQFLRIPCLYIGCYKEGNGIIVQAGLFCVVNLLKWVACMIYFHECKERKVKKKVDEELGKDTEAVHE